MSLDFSRNGYEAMFRVALKQGINLFCGAGFSVEASDTDGAKLPVGEELLNELKKNFPAVQNYQKLPFACTKITKTDKQSFYTFLEKRFTVKDFDPQYLSLLDIRIKNIYTTNIDDLFFKIYERSEQPFYLNDCSTRGAAYDDQRAVHYYPLHGCIRNNQNYVFGATEIASVFSQRNNEKSWKSLASDSAKHPILFWGWNFQDPGPIQAMYGDNNNVDDNANRWVLLRNPNEEMLDYFESLKFNVIIGDTKRMLEYISDFVSASAETDEQVSVNDDTLSLLEPYVIPENGEKLPAYPLKKFFLEYTPRWSHIYSRSIPKTSNYKKIANSIASGKSTIVMGIRGSGKTTLMMQLLADYETTRLKHMLIAPSIDQVQNYIKLLNGKRSLLFVDDCFRDTNALIQLFNAPNIQIVCFDRDFNYERQYHRIQPYTFNLIDVTEITKEDAQSIVNIIPIELRRDNAGTKNFEKDPTILNLLAMDLKAMNFRFMTCFHEKDAIAAKVFLMIAYVHSCGKAVFF